MFTKRRIQLSKELWSLIDKEAQTMNITSNQLIKGILTIYFSDLDDLLDEITKKDKLP